MGSKKTRTKSRPTNDSVIVGYCHGDRIHPAFMSSYEGVLVRDLLTTRRLLGKVDAYSSGAHVATGRCRIVRKFLEHPKRPDWLWMIDTDATFPVTILDQLMASADPVERPIVGGLAFGVKPETDDQGRELVNECRASVLELFPTLYLFNEAGKTFRLWNYPQNELVEVHGTGCHCLLIHRSVLEHPCWDTEHPLPWFRSGTVLAGGEVSEDLFFCIEARRAGFPIHVNTAAKTGHIKEVVVDEDAYRRQLEAKGLAGKAVPPIPEMVLIVPSRARPERAAELAEAWRKTTTGRSSLWFAVDDDDDVNAYTVALGTDVQLFAGPRQRLCGWTNDLALDAVQGGARVVASIGDDHRLVGDWETQVLDAVGDGPAIVYGDDGIQGEALPTACFVSAVIVDALGWMCLPGLEHLYCDNVWKVLGEKAGVLRYLPDMSTPHLHPVAGKAEWDDSYRESNHPAKYEADRRVFEAWLANGADRDAATVTALVKVPA